MIKTKKRTPWMTLLLETHAQLKVNQPGASFKSSMIKASAMKSEFDKQFEGRTPTSTELRDFVTRHLNIPSST